MFSQTAEYALRAVVWLASHADAPVTRGELARATKVPPDYLSKVMQHLGRNGIVHARPGRNGGFTLTRSADKVSVLDVVNSVDPIQRIKKCPLGIKAHGHNLCPLHTRMDAAIQMIERTFREASIGDIIHSEPPSKPLCFIDGVRNA